MIGVVMIQHRVNHSLIIIIQVLLDCYLFLAIIKSSYRDSWLFFLRKYFTKNWKIARHIYEKQVYIHVFELIIMLWKAEIKNWNQKIVARQCY